MKKFATSAWQAKLRSRCATALFLQRAISPQDVVLEAGSVRTFKAYGNKKVTIATLQPPAIFVEMGCFDQGKYHSSPLARKGLIPRLATLLLEKVENGVVAGMTHKDLADRLCLPRESVTATLGELRRAGMIKIERKKIFILQRERLERAILE